MRTRSTASLSPGRTSRPLGPRRGARVPRTPAQVQRILDALGVTPRRAWGQSFLVDPTVAEREAGLLDLPPGNAVVEIGGGLGLLTEALLERGYVPLTVIEREPRLAAFLASTFGERIRLLWGDARSVPLPRADAFVGNLPFSVAQPILQRVLGTDAERGVFLVQREVGERLTAHVGQSGYGRLAIWAALAGDFRLGARIPRSAFYPSPRVEGVLLTFRRGGNVPRPADPALFSRLLSIVFSYRRKMLGPTIRERLSRELGRPGEEVHRAVERSDWPEDWARRRPEELSPEAFVRLCDQLSQSSSP